MSRMRTMQELCEDIRHTPPCGGFRDNPLGMPGEKMPFEINWNSLADAVMEVYTHDVDELRNALMAIRDLAKKTKSRSENINVALTTIFWYANGALIETEKGEAE